LARACRPVALVPVILDSALDPRPTVSPADLGALQSEPPVCQSRGLCLWV